jgi:Glycosyl hydrolase family 65, N-terminal domain
MSTSDLSAPEDWPGRIDEFPSPPELARLFWIIALGWDNTTVANQHEDTRLLHRDLEALLRLGVCIAVITGTDFFTIDRQLSGSIHGAHKRHLYLLTNRGSEVYGFDHGSHPVLLWHRSATAEEDHLLIAIAKAARERLMARTGLEIRLIDDRLKRRTLDLMPLPEWHDLPHSSRGALFQAVERHLTGAGLRGGLREAVALVAQIAREHGLTDARITCDGKHIEIGLTDFGDAIRWVMGELAQRRDLPHERILIVGSEFGSPGGVEGRNYEMLTSYSRGAVVVSVGPEPAGVVHLGGGPTRLRALLRAQIAAHRRLGQPPGAVGLEAVATELPARIAADPAWLLVEAGVMLAREHEVESLFAVANGYVGTRGALEEGSSHSAPATFVAGVFGLLEMPGPVPELVDVPDWTLLRLAVNGEHLTLEAPGTLDHRRLLDLQQGMLWREWRYHDSAGRITRLRFLRLASLADRHVLVQAVTLTAENYSGWVRLESGFRQTSGLVVSPQPMSAAGPRGLPPEALRLEGRAPGTGTTTALVGMGRLHTDGTGPLTPGIRPAQEGFSQHYDLEAEIGRTWRLDRLVGVYTSREVVQPAEVALGHLDRVIAEGGVPAVIDAHRRAWDERWQASDVQVEGDPEAQRALRFALYHLISAANPEDERVSVEAHGLTGKAYNRHSAVGASWSRIFRHTIAHKIPQEAGAVGHAAPSD